MCCQLDAYTKVAVCMQDIKSRRILAVNGTSIPALRHDLVLLFLVLRQRQWLS